MQDKNKITTDFEKFKEEQNKEVKKNKEFNQLSDDITILRKLDNGDYEKAKGPFNIIQITGIITDDKEIDKIENQLSESVPGAPVWVPEPVAVRGTHREKGLLLASWKSGDAVSPENP